MIYILDKALIVSMHKKQISLYGGILGIRDEGLLDSTIAALFQTFANVELFPTIEEKAAHLAYGLIQNHAFIDGNKRTGIHAMLIFLRLNQITLDYTQQELINITLEIASGNITCEKFTEWIREHIQ